MRSTRLQLSYLITEVYECNLKTMKWYMINASGENAPGCYGLSGVVYQNMMVLFGGGDGRNWYNSIYMYKLGDNSRQNEMKVKLGTAMVKKTFYDINFKFIQDEKRKINDNLYFLNS